MTLPPVFIGGAGRSGTTLVADLLGRHPAISPVYETDFVVSIIDVLGRNPPLAPEEATRMIGEIMEEWTLPLPNRPHSKRGHEKYLHGPHYVLFERGFALERTRELCADLIAGGRDDSFQRFVEDLFAEHSRLDGKPFWVNKTPAYVGLLPRLRDLWPGMRFIHSVRDGRDVACSVLTRPWGPTTFPEAAAWWRDTIAPGIRFARQFPEMCRVVRLEDLVVGAPHRALQGLTDWLGVEGDIPLPAEAAEDRLDAARMGTWKETIPPDDLAAFHRIAGGALHSLGYEVSEA